jgi:hypothetical protein
MADGEAAEAGGRHEPTRRVRVRASMVKRRGLGTAPANHGGRPVRPFSLSPDKIITDATQSASQK